KYLIKAILGKPQCNALFSEFDVLKIKQLYLKNVILYINKNKDKFQQRQTPYNLRESSITFTTIRSRLTVCNRQLNFMSNKLANIIPSSFIRNKISKSLINGINQ
ncbi:hypothetical protein LSTR_LSTR016024, partial [Laodelphax striatellus]